VVFFYPKQVRLVAVEACDLRDNFERFQANNYVFGISADAAKAKAQI
jgi:peroxiredoxin Q/BCP